MSWQKRRKETDVIYFQRIETRIETSSPCDCSATVLMPVLISQQIEYHQKHTAVLYRNSSGPGLATFRHHQLVAKMLGDWLKVIILYFHSVKLSLWRFISSTGIFNLPQGFNTKYLTFTGNHPSKAFPRHLSSS